MLPFKNRILTNYKDGTNDNIIKVLEGTFYKASDDVKQDDFYKYFAGDNLEDTAYNVWKYVKDNVNYKEDGQAYQKIKLPGALLHYGEGDCKSMSLFCAAVLSHYAPDRVGFRYVSYRNDPTPTHVYCIVKDRNKTIIVDPVWNTFNSSKDYKYKIDKIMTIQTLSGIKSTKVDKQTYDALFQLRNAIKQQEVGSPMYNTLNRMFNNVASAAELDSPDLPIGSIKSFVKKAENKVKGAIKKAATDIKKAATDIKADVKNKPSWASQGDYVKHLAKKAIPLFIEMRTAFLLLLTVNYRNLCNRILEKEKADPNSMSRLWYVGFGGDPKALLAACEANKNKKPVFGKPKKGLGAMTEDQLAQTTAALTQANAALTPADKKASGAGAGTAVSATAGTALTTALVATGAVTPPVAAALGAALALAGTVVAVFVANTKRDGRDLTDEPLPDPTVDVNGDGIPDLDEGTGENLPGGLSKTALIGIAALGAGALWYFSRKK
jgi:hypothetical protein